MFPPIWGSLFHDTLQMMALSYSAKPNDDQKLSMNLFLLNMFKNLPCPACRMHATQYFNKHPPDLSSSESLYKWLIDFHNVINDRTGKRSDWTVSEARKSLSERYFTNVRDLSRSQTLRLEDHKQIIALKSENSILRQKLGLPVDEENDVLSAAAAVVGMSKNLQQNRDGDTVGNNDTATNTESYALATLVLTIIVVLLLIALSVVYYRKK
jgi:hypothetical protein